MQSEKEWLTQLIEASFEEQYNKRGLLTASHTAEHLLANGVTVRNRGRWIIHPSGKAEIPPKYAECSVCHVTGSPQWKSCPVCDSLMEG